MRSLLGRRSILISGFALALLVIQLSNTFAQAVPSRIIDRIVVIYHKSGECSGFIISSTQAITAGHCLKEWEKEVRVAIYPNRSSEKRLTGIVKQRVLDASGDIAILELEQPLNFESFALACPPGTGTHVVVSGFPGGSDRNNPSMPLATPAFAELIFTGGYYSPEDRDTISRLELSPGTVVKITYGSSGSPVFVKDDSDWSLLGVLNTKPSSSSDTADYNATAVSPFVENKQRCFQAASTTSSVKVLPGNCFVSNATGTVLYEQDCKKWPGLTIEASNMLAEFTAVVEIEDIKSREIIDTFRYKLTGGPGLKVYHLRFRSDMLGGQNKNVTVRVRILQQPSVVSSIPSMAIGSSVTGGTGCHWNDKGKFVVPLNMGLVENVVITVTDGEKELVKGNYTVMYEGVANYVIEIEKSKVPPGGADLNIKFKNGVVLTYKALVHPPASAS